MDRERLTITLKKSLLTKVDGFIDGTKIRNRSHAIEYLVTQSLSPRVNQAVILVGGKGLNMRPFTFEMPKGLFPVGGRPILEHIMERLKKYEIRDIIFSIGHLGEKIREHFGDGKKFDVKITYVDESKEAGTGGALVLAKKYLKGESFLVIHGDILIDINLSDLVAFHKEQGTVGTIALTSVVDPSSFGEVILHGARIKQFIEKPEKGRQTSQLINSGLYVFDREIFDYLPKTGNCLLEDIFSKLAQNRQLSGFLFAGRWVDIGTPQSYEKAIKEWGKI
ncbi:nucleotidyltransferase family protein [Candidatus Microgenomates bacterium]|nr:nucleotidyltransferase family protein [Candidatus Microgenomates bacterium]